MKKILLTLVLALGLLTANAQIEKLAGPRIGVTFIGAGPVADFLHEGFDFDDDRDGKHGSTGPAFTTQYGWQWETRFVDNGEIHSPFDIPPSFNEEDGDGACTLYANGRAYGSRPNEKTYEGTIFLEGDGHRHCTICPMLPLLPDIQIPETTEARHSHRIPAHVGTMGHDTHRPRRPPP